MGKITGFEKTSDIPSKVLMLYDAIEQLIVEGVDINTICVSTITEKAGIGKGTAYDYFDTKEDILACAILFYIRKVMNELRTSLEAYDCFPKKIEYLLAEIGENRMKHQCVMRYIHMMTDTSGLSRTVQKKINCKEADKYLLVGVFEDILEEGIRQGEVRKDIPLDYMVYVLLSKILSYILCVCGERFEHSQEIKIRSFVYQSIVNELCEKIV